MTYWIFEDGSGSLDVGEGALFSCIKYHFRAGVHPMSYREWKRGIGRVSEVVPRRIVGGILVHGAGTAGLYAGYVEASDCNGRVGSRGGIWSRAWGQDKLFDLEVSSRGVRQVSGMHLLVPDHPFYVEAMCLGEGVFDWGTTAVVEKWLT